MLANILVLQVLVVSLLVLLTSAYCDADPRWLTWGEIGGRVVRISPYVGFLVLVYAFNQWSHTTGQDISTTIGQNITIDLYAIEGDLVADLQRSIPEMFVEYFTVVYVFGFSFLLVFPIVAYFVLPSRRHLEELFVAYAVNYGVGALCYVLFIAYGPRNVIGHVGQPMYEHYPELATLTGSVNSAANVFPSLHASLTLTVVLLAWRTRAVYPRWLWLSSVVTANVAISTMYLGIHWLLDVIAGILLAVLSVLVAVYVVDRTNDFWNDSGIDVGTERS